MGETYRFYVKMDGEKFGPYTARETRDLDLLDDVLVTEERMNGQWLPASKFDFDDMVRKESGEVATQSQPFVVEGDGTVYMGGTYDPDNVPKEIKGWNWGAFFFGWIWASSNGIHWPILVYFISYVGVIIVSIILGKNGNEWDEWAVSNGIYWLILVYFISYVGVIIMSIILGKNGNEWAWKKERWDNVERFKRVQHNWAMACLWSLGFIFIIAAVVSAFD